MFEFPIKQRKLTTYGRKTSRPGSYNIARDDASPERPKQSTLLGWKNGTSSASTERQQATAISGRLIRPSPKKSKDTLWDGPSEEDEPVRPLKSTSKSPSKVATPRLLASKHSRAKSVPRHDISVKEIQNAADNDKKRKREMGTRAPSEAPRDIVKNVDNFEVPVEEKRTVRRAKSIEPSRPLKPRAPVPVEKKDLLDVFDYPSEDELAIRPKKSQSVSRKKKETKFFDITMEEQEPVIATQSRTTRPRESSQPPKQQARTPSVTRKKEKNVFDVPMEYERPAGAKAPRPAPSKMKAMDIFDFPSEDEGQAVAKSTKASKSKGSAQPPPRKRARTPATDINDLIPTRRGQTKTPEPSRIHSATRRTKTQTIASEPSRQNMLQKLRSPTAIPKSTKRLPGVGWHPSLAIHSSPKRRLQQGSSAPAALFSMIREQRQSPPTDSSDNVTRPASPHLDFVEMDVDTTPATPPLVDLGSRSTVRAAPSSQTPRQKHLWGQLLGPELGDGLSDLPISKLNLKTTHKPPSMARALSDIPQTTFARRSRLIDSLKASAPIVEEDEEDDNDDTTMESSPEPSATAIVNPTLAGPRVSIRTASTKVTYAQQRTFLEEKNEEAMYDILAEELSQQTSGYGSQSQNNLFDDSDLEDSQEAHPRGVHDLRAAGSKRRLLDELDHLVDDVQGMAVATVSARRSALMEVAEKLMEPTAATIFLDSGMDLRLIKSMDDMTDTTFTFLAATTIALLADSGATLNTLDKVHRSKMFGRIVGLLFLEQDISKVVKDRRSNMSKIAQASVVDFKNTILKSRLFTNATPRDLPPQMLALRCLDSVIRKFRDQGSRANLIDHEAIAKLLRVVQSRITLDAIDIAVLEPTISILEAHTLSRSTGWSLELVRLFVQILPPIFGSSDPALQHSKFLALRLSLNLTNENPAASDIFALPSLTKMLMLSINQNYALLRVKVASEDHAVNVDNTVLALGVMINLAEFSDQVRISVLDGGDELLTKAVRLFLESKELADKADSVEEGQTNVAFGYLAFMLGNLCQNEKVRSRVRRQLPGGRLTLLLEEMQEFIKIHQRADKVRLEGAEGEELERGHTQRLQALVDTLAVLDY